MRQNSCSLLTVIVLLPHTLFGRVMALWFVLRKTSLPTHEGCRLEVDCYSYYAFEYSMASDQQAQLKQLTSRIVVETNSSTNRLIVLSNKSMQARPSSHSVLPLSNQQPIDRTKSLHYILFFFNNLFHTSQYRKKKKNLPLLQFQHDFKMHKGERTCRTLRMTSIPFSVGANSMQACQFV